MKAFLAEGMALTGDLDNALRLIDEQIAQIERPGWEERFYYAEILRLKGWMLSLKGDLEGAERNFLASLDWARHQQAKMWELRTSTSLARLWQSQGKRQDAYELLAPIYDWFTEGFDTQGFAGGEGFARRAGVVDSARPLRVRIRCGILQDAARRCAMDSGHPRPSLRALAERAMTSYPAAMMRCGINSGDISVEGRRP